MADAGLTETARFLAAHPPFTTLDPDELGRLVAVAEIEFHARGAVILAEGGAPVRFLWVIHSGAVDVLHRGTLLDLLGAGDTFGGVAMISGLPPGFEARAAEDTLCYRIPVTVARPLLEQFRRDEPRSGARSPSLRHVATLVRTPTVRCGPSETVGEVARLMTERGSGCAVIELANGELGIVTDRDLRTRVLAAGKSAAVPVAEVMTTPVFTVAPDRVGGEVLFEMLERGVRHAPIVTAQGRVLGVVSEADLFAAQARPWFGARRAIAHARDLDALGAVAARVTQVVLDLGSVELKALEVARVLSALTDALLVRALELIGGDDAGIAWLALGSHARRELTPATLALGTLVLDVGEPPAWAEPLSEALVTHGFARPLPPRTARQWEADAGLERWALSALVDRRQLWGAPMQPLPLAAPSERERLLGQLRADMRAYAVPTGFDEGALLDLSGRRSERFDIRASVTAPIVAFARWGGLVAGTTEGSTLERLAHAAQHGVISDEDARTLSDAFEIAYGLRVSHQLEQLTAGEPPDDVLDPATLSGLARSQLREIFRAVRAVQQKLPVSS